MAGGRSTARASPLSPSTTERTSPPSDESTDADPTVTEGGAADVLRRNYPELLGGAGATPAVASVGGPDGSVAVSYSDPEYLADRHGLERPDGALEGWDRAPVAGGGGTGA